MRNGAADYKGSVPTAASKASTTLDIARLHTDDIHDFVSSFSKGVDYQHGKPISDLIEIVSLVKADIPEPVLKSKNAYTDFFFV
jgi:hypothetical protein